MDFDQAKTKHLEALIARNASVAIAFSGGVDSALLLDVAHEVLGDSVCAVTVAAAFVPEREVEEARAFCRRRGIRHEVRIVNVLADASIAANPENRCYLCKKRIFAEIFSAAREAGAEVVFDGSNVSDQSDFRPGMKALAELGVASPLLQAGFTKDDIRFLSRERGLETATKQSFACLATRFATGEGITLEGLRRVDAAEQFLLDAGFSQLRVRSHGDVARIEIPESQFARLLDATMRGRVVEAVKAAGFRYVSLDLEGYRTGSMNDRREDVPA